MQLLTSANKTFINRVAHKNRPISGRIASNSEGKAIWFKVNYKEVQKWAWHLLNIEHAKVVSK